MINELNTLLKDGVSSSAVESTIEDDTKAFLIVMQENSTPEEFSKIMESLTEYAAYGLVDLDVVNKCLSVETVPATEGVKISSKTIVKFNKAAILNRLQKRNCILLAERANDSNFVKYKKYRTLMKEFREKIYTRYGSKSTSLARKQLQNMRNKSSAMPSDAGKNITAKIDTAISHANLDHAK